jgi:GT2 family glycosyltransferase
MASAAIDLSIIVVNWNSKEYVRECVESVERSIRSVRYEVIVVDSGSFDGCGEMLALSHPAVRFIQIARNVGFGQANNIGAKHACGEMLLLLNPDTYVYSGTIDTLLAHARTLENAGVVGCRLVNTDGTLQASCVQVVPTILNQLINIAMLQRLFPSLPPLQSACSFEKASRPVPVQVLSGACMMIARNAFEEVGGFSSDYFMYGEDIDLCHKLRSHGRANYYCRSVEVVHHGGKSSGHKASGFSEVMMREAVYRFLRKTRGEAYGGLYRIALAGVALVRLTLVLLMLPCALASGGLRHLVRLTAKWIAVLRWTFGLEHWVRDYDVKIEAGGASGELPPSVIDRATARDSNAPFVIRESTAIRSGR